MTKKNVKTTIILAAVVSAVVGYVYVFEVREPESKEASKKEDLKLFKANEGQVKSLRLKWIEGESVLEKVEDHWLVIKPIRDSADVTAVNTLLKGISDDKADEVVAEGENIDLGVFGLKDPLGTVEITLEDNSTQTLLFGQVDALQGKKYGYIQNAKRIVLLDAMIQTRFVKTSKDLRQKRVQRLNKADVVQIDAKSFETNMSVSVMKKDGQWAYGDKPWELDTQSVEAYLGQLESVNATDFLAEDKRDPAVQIRHKLGQKLLVLKIKDTSSKEEEIVFHHKDGNNVVLTSSLSPIVYRTSVGFLNNLVVKNGQFRNRSKPFEFNKEAVESIEIQTELTKLSLKKVGTEWGTENLPAGKKLDSTQVAKLLEQLSALKVESFLGEGKKNFAKKGSISLKAKEAIPLLDFSWGGDHDAKSKIASSSRINEFITVDKSSVAQLPLQVLLTDEKPSPPKAGEVKVIEEHK